MVLISGKLAAENVTAIGASKPTTHGDSPKINIFAVTSKEIEKSVLDAGQALKEQTGLESFPSKGFQIHCTLYMSQFETSKINDIKAVVASLTKSLHSFPIQTSGLSKTKENWLFIDLEKNSKLQEVADKIVNLLYPLRDINQTIPDWAKAYPKKLELFEKYGSPNVFSELQPHLTLLAKGDEGNLVKFLEKNKDRQFFGRIMGNIVGLGVGEADIYGQVEKPMAIWYFSQADSQNPRQQESE